MQSIKYTLVFIVTFTALSCKKYLDTRPDASLTVPTTIDDYQKIFDYQYNSINNSPTSIAELSTDNAYMPLNQFNAQQPIVRNAYTWADDIWGGTNSPDWITAYVTIYNANVILDGLQEISPSKNETTDYNNLKGSSLLLRALMHLDLSQIFCKPYSPVTAKTDPGIPYRTNSIITTPTGRSTVQNTYDQIIADLNNAIPLLNTEVDPIKRNRGNKPSAYAILARTYLIIGDYENAKKYADSSLSKYNKLTDYNTVPYTSKIPFRAPLIAEPMFITSGTSYFTFYPVDSALYNTYDDNDIRKQAFFSYNSGYAIHQFKGSYLGGVQPFDGPATDEVYLIRSESNARLGNLDQALADLNIILENRFFAGTFTPYKKESVTDVLGLILQERRKELVYRGLRWSDLRRLNADPARRTTLTRIIDSKTYTLEPESNKYVLPIPPDELKFNNIEQNPR